MDTDIQIKVIVEGSGYEHQEQEKIAQYVAAQLKDWPYLVQKKEAVTFPLSLLHELVDQVDAEEFGTLTVQEIVHDFQEKSILYVLFI